MAQNVYSVVPLPILLIFIISNKVLQCEPNTSILLQIITGKILKVVAEDTQPVVISGNGEDEVNRTAGDV